jgi:CBS domain-containing protein
MVVGRGFDLRGGSVSLILTRSDGARGEASGVMRPGRTAMLVADILHHKGNEIVTIAATATVEAAAKMLTDKRIGALVVRDRLGRLAGIFSERDVAAALAHHGAAARSMSVGELMTTDVITCKPGDAVRDIMALITQRRIRHLPVVEGERLVGLVSIGDVLKSRLDEKEHEVQVLRDLTVTRA